MGFMASRVKARGRMFENIDISKPALMRGGEGPHAVKGCVHKRAPAQWRVQLPCFAVPSVIFREYGGGSLLVF